MCEQTAIRPETFFGLPSGQRNFLRSLILWGAASLAWVLLAASDGAARADQPDSRLPTRWRRPVAACWIDPGNVLAVANRASGTVSLVDVSQGSVISETDFGDSLVDLVPLPSHKRWAALDGSKGEVIFFEVDGLAADQPEAHVRVIDRIPVCSSPVAMAVGPEGSSLAVAGLWSRQVDVVGLAADGGGLERPRRSVSLPFTPRCLHWLSADRLSVWDAFAGSVAVVDVSEGRVESVRTLPVHNVRGVTAVPDRSEIVFTHQELNSIGRTTYNDVLWGQLITNHYRRVDVAALLDPEADLEEASRPFAIGQIGFGAADPAELVFDGDGQLIIALAGVDEVGIYRGGESFVDRPPVGRRPLAVVPLPGVSRVLAVNSLSDSLSLVDTETGETLREISLGPHPPEGPAERGEALFFQGGLSKDGWMSCHSCHTDGHSTGQLVDTLGDESFDTPKRVLSLLGVAHTAPWAWNGQVTALLDQVKKSVKMTMQGEPLLDRQADDLVAYLETLEPPPGFAPPESKDDHELIARGRELFASLGCVSCHDPAQDYTSKATYDVGLVDEAGHREFNPPSLRGVGYRPQFFHDRRANSLEAVLTDVRHQLDVDLSSEDVAALLRFLESL